MQLPFSRIVVLIAFNIYCTFAISSENIGLEDTSHSYHIVKLIQKTAEYINITESLKSLDNEDSRLLNGLGNIFPVSISPALLNLFPEATSEKCVEDLKYVLESALFPGGWSMKMLDSYGKPESGILLGNLKWLGEYDECVGIYAPPSKNSTVGGFRGKYCTLQVPLKLGSVSLSISSALCLPDSCYPNVTIFSTLGNYRLNESFSFLNGRLQSAFSNATLTCKATSRELTAAAFVVICILSFFAFLVVIGSSITAFEYYLEAKISEKYATGAHYDSDNSAVIKSKTQKHNENLTYSNAEKESKFPASLSKYKPFFDCFCIFTNGGKLLNVSSSEGQLPCLHGIRFLSMTWVILCHSYGNVGHIVKNMGEAGYYTNHWTFQIIINGFFAVDSFFVLSGFLVGYLFFQQAQKTDGRISWLYFYIHRYIRLTPVYMMVVAFHATLSPFLSSGPLSPDYDIDQNCKDNWWYNVLYINNFLSINLKQCMGWSWYLANDMQFYAVSPLFLITLWRWPKVGYSLLGMFFCITFVCNIVLTYKYNLIAGFGDILQHTNDLPNFIPRMNDFYDILYSKPYARIGSYLVGLILAYYVYKRKCNNSPRLNWITILVGWIIASGIALTCQFGLYHQTLTTVQASIYNALSRVGFSLGLGWVIFVCVIGQGGVVNSILSWKIFIPLSRLTYSAYLVHPIVSAAYSSSLKSLLHFSHMTAIMLYLGYLVISYIVALVTSLLFESPLIRLERLVRNKFSS